MIFLKPEANQALKDLFPELVDDVPRYFACKDSELTLAFEGMIVPARPTIVDTTTKQTRIQEGELSIPYNLIQFSFHYASKLDDKKNPIGFTIQGHEDSRRIDSMGTDYK